MIDGGDDGYESDNKCVHDRADVESAHIDVHCCICVCGMVLFYTSRLCLATYALAHKVVFFITNDCY